MKKHLFLFTLGPVQSFIAQAIYLPTEIEENQQKKYYNQQNQKFQNQL